MINLGYSCYIEFSNSKKKRDCRLALHYRVQYRILVHFNLFLTEVWVHFAENTFVFYDLFWRDWEFRRWKEMVPLLER